MRRRFQLFVVVTVISSVSAASAQHPSSEQVQLTSPVVRRAEPPSASATAEELEQRADELRAEKAYLDALDYYRTALKKKPESPSMHNKAGICELQLRRFKDATRDFERSIRQDGRNPDFYNNLGAAYHLERKYGKAIKQYEKAIQLRQDAASFYSNLGSAYFARKEFEKAVAAYNQAVQLDPDVFDRTSRTGITAQTSASSEDRAHYDYVLAKLFAKTGNSDRSLQYLRRAMEEGYKGIENVFKDAEFAGLRKDHRFTELMAARPTAIPE
jgi:tetratricopeptide (TPR) repeat protein